MFVKLLEKLGYVSNRKSEKFNVERVFDDMAQEGFRLLIKNDILMQRNADIKQEIEKIMHVLHTAKTEEEMKAAVTMAYALIHHASTAWLRIMENRWLGSKISDFLEQYVALIDASEYYPDLVNEAKMICSIFTNIDVEPLKPLIINTSPRDHRTKIGEWEGTEVK